MQKSPYVVRAMRAVPDQEIQSELPLGFGFGPAVRRREHLAEELVGEIGGLGPLDPLLLDESITEIMVNGPRHLYIERRGKIERVDSYFLNDEHVLRIIDRIITPGSGTRVHRLTNDPSGEKPTVRVAGFRSSCTLPLVRL